MKKLILIGLFISGFFMLESNAAHLQDHLLISARMDGAQEVPAVITNAVGIGAFTINKTRDTVCVNVTATNLSGPITGIHIHDGAVGMNGGVLINLTSFVSGNRVVGKITGADLSAVNLSKMLAGETYLNIHTTVNPNGEIRGQLLLETDISFVAMLSGEQEVPAVTTSAFGLGVFNLNKDHSRLSVSVVFQNLSNFTGAHLHRAAAGMNGPVIVNLTSMVSGNTITATIDNPSQGLIDSLKSGMIYLNVHTTGNPNGEIRGQLMYNSKYIYFDASLSGDQEVPAVSVPGAGNASVRINTTFDTLWYNIAADNMSGAITGAHFHAGVFGMSGGVELNISSSIMGNRIDGMITGTDLTSQRINAFLRGGMYLNLHTTTNPNGEIRGQVYRLTREGYTISLDGGQSVPFVNTTASGSGIVSIDRDQKSAHFMIVADGLAINAAHFHKAVMGESGGVEFDLGPFAMNNGIFGYWNQNSTPAFTTQNSVQFRNDSIYVNVHTTANPNGEIRGQVDRGFECKALDISTGILNIRNQISSISMITYPNPAENILNLDIESDKNVQGQIRLFSIIGNEIMEQTVRIVSGQNIVKLNLQDVTSGIYLIQFSIGTETQTMKFSRR